MVARSVRRERDKPMAECQVALLRGINVGKAKRVAMADLRKLFSDLGYGDVRTVLNSGNVVFTAAKQRDGSDGARIEKAVADRLGVTARVTVLTAKEVTAAVRENPLSAVADNPSRLLLMVLRDPAAVARVKPLLEEDWAPEALALRRRIAYLWCPGGIVDSPLGAAVHHAGRDAVTGRNIATMTKLLALVEGS